MAPAELIDLETCVLESEKYFEEIKKTNPQYSFDRDMVRNQFYCYIQSDDAYVVLARVGDVVKGMALVTLSPTISNPKNRIAIEVIWHTDPSLPKYERLVLMEGLRYEMEVWTKSKDVKYLMIGAHTKTCIPSMLKEDGYFEGNISMIKEVS
jgi:hypothetical protein